MIKGFSSSSQAGVAFILALVTVAIISMLIAGGLTLAVSHLALSVDNRDYSNALNLAEAGVNYELWKIGAKLWRGLPVQYDASPGYTRTLSLGSTGQTTGTFTVYVEESGWNPDNKEPFHVISTGTVNGISRTIRYIARGGPSIDQEYAIFGISSLPASIAINGSGSPPDVWGTAGTNGQIDTRGSGVLFEGDLGFFGSTEGGFTSQTPNVSGEITYDAVPMWWPTVDQIANQVSGTTQGISYFSTHNDNASTPFGPSANWKYSGSGTLPLGPGNYYLESFKLTGGATMQIDNTTDQPVNLWINAKSAVDFGGNTLTFTGTVVNFHIYFAVQPGYDPSKVTLTIGGTSNFYGCVYAYDGAGGATVNVQGTGNIYGSLIGYQINVKGSGQIIYQQPTGPPIPVPGYFFGTTRQWQELNPNE